MGKTISFVKGKGSLSHNNRDFVAENVDQDRMDWNVYYIQQSLREAYDQLFGAAVAEYNAALADRLAAEANIDAAQQRFVTFNICLNNVIAGGIAHNAAIDK